MKLADKENIHLISERLILDSSSYRRISIQLGLISLLFFVVYAPTFASLIRMWWESDDYSHGFLVPVISLYFVWLKRDQLSRIRLEPAFWTGGFVVLVAGFLFVVSRLGDFVLLQEISLPVMIAGMVLLLGGKVFLQILVLPIGYLFFMIKIFGEGSDRFHWPFQILAAKIGIGILHLLGFTAYQEDNFIQLPNAILEVASACSGIRFLMSIIAIGIPLAYLTQKTWGRRIALVLFAVVIAILANGARVALIGIWTYYHGTNMIHGPFHIFYGVFVSWIGFIALFVGAWFFEKFNKKEEPPFLKKSSEIAISGENGPERNFAGQISSFHWNLSWGVGILFLVIIGGYTYFHQVAPLLLSEGFSGFPLKINGWAGKEIDLKTEPFRVSKADQELLRIYTKEGQQDVKIYVGYFDSQTPEKKLVTYTTSWKFHQGETKVNISLDSGGSCDVNEAILKEGSDLRAVLFWYDINGRIVSNRYFAKLWFLWDAFIFGRSNGALVVLSVPFETKNNLDGIIKNEKTFLKDLIHPLHEYLDVHSGSLRNSEA